VRPGGAGRSARAAYVLALLLAAAALAPAPRDEPCAAPRERAAAGGWSAEVGCAGRGGELRGPARLLFGLAIDPNHADRGTLEALPGIGAARAAALAEARAGRPFCGPEDLGRVKGIGPKTRRSVEGWLSFAPDRTQGCGAGP
jgi:hypothetical protein